MRNIAVALLLAFIAAPALGQSNEHNGIPPRWRATQSVDRVIVKWQKSPTATSTAISSKVQRLTSSAGIGLQRKQQITSDTDVLQLDRHWTKPN